ncbi:sulfatase [Haloferula sp. A504]|uniref:sulfatase n=1 Tax=Haloferula sp. A504 TaxID=3373601 RepID=UPI0031BE8DDB|nr:sulfatase [Verrucomicrobiaceae bacterium E54]
MIAKFLLALVLAAPVLAAKRPNLLLITVDDMNRDSVGAYGCPIPDITPNIDRLASQGIQFDRGFVNVAICQPCRAVLMTGRYPQTSGALGFDKIKPGVPTLPEALKKAGYYNSLIAKEAHVVPSRHAAFDRIDKQRDLGGGRSAGAYAKAVRSAIREAGEANKPFFITANAADPHRPFAGSSGDAFKKVPYPREIDPKDVPVPGFLPDLPDIRTELATYFQSVARADQVVGTILDELEKSGEAGNTLVLFLSDHGMPLPFAKTNCYLTSNITPWILRWPGHIDPGSSDKKHFVSGIDVAPTFLDAAGLGNLEGADGSSFLPLLKGGEQPARNKVFTFHQKPFSGKRLPMRAVNDGDYLYIWNGWSDGETQFRNESMSGLTFKAMNNADDPAIRARADFYLHRTREELYDIRKDPDCLHNLLDEPGGKYSGQTSAMTKALWHWMKKVDDPELETFEDQVELALD